MSPATSRSARTIHAPVESWHRTRRDRRRRRLHLFQSADRPRSLWRARLHLQFPQEFVRNIKTASTCTSTGVHRSSCRSRSWLASWAMSTRRSAATAVQATDVGCFQSQVVGVGPQIGFLFPVGDMQGYLNLKAYGEFDAANRPSGWNTWFTFSISPPGARSGLRQTKPIVGKY